MREGTKNQENTKDKNKGKLLCPKIDVVFHSLFREENKHLLEALVSTVLQEKVTIKTMDKNRYVEIEDSKEKLGIMDLRAELSDKTQCLIEIQLKEQVNEIERMLYYWSNSYSRQLLRGNEYIKLNKTISIVILDHEIEEMKGFEELGIKWQIRDNFTGKQVLTENFEMVIIEIPKAIRVYERDKENPISQWMMFLNNPNKSEVSQIMKENKEVKFAYEELEKVSGDEKLRRIAELREKAIRDDKAALDFAIQKGMKQGIEQGMKQGEEIGKRKNQIEIVKNLLKENISIEQIKRITGLSEEEIKNI